MMHDGARGLQEDNRSPAAPLPCHGPGPAYFGRIGSGFFAPPGIGVRSTLTVIATST